MIIEIMDDNFQTEIIERKDVHCLVDFWGTHCGPCKMLEPILYNISEKFKDKLVVGKYNVEEGHSLAGNYGVISLPTLILFKDGKVIWTQAGLIPQAKIEAKIRESL